MVLFLLQCPLRDKIMHQSLHPRSCLEALGLDTLYAKNPSLLSLRYEAYFRSIMEQKLQTEGDIAHPQGKAQTV